MPRLNHPVTITAIAAIAAAFTSYLFASLLPHDKIQDFISIFNTIVLFLTLAVVSYYTYETLLLRKVAENNLSNSVRPILVMLQGENFIFENVGSGSAINICPVIFTNEHILIASPENIPIILPPKNKLSVKISVVTTKENLISSASFAKKKINDLTINGKPFVLVLYTDIYGNAYYTTIFTNVENHQSAVDFGSII